MCLTHPTTEKDPRQGSQPSKCLNRWSYRHAFSSPATRGLKKDSDRAITPGVETVHVPAHLGPPGSPQAKQLCHLHVRPSLGQSCHGQNKSCIYACRVASVVSDPLRPCRLLCQGGGFSWQEYWSILASTGCHTPLEHYISCCPGCQLP